MSGLEASLVLIGVTLGLTIVVAVLTRFTVVALYRLRFGRRPGRAGRGRYSSG